MAGNHSRFRVFVLGLSLFAAPFLMLTLRPAAALTQVRSGPRPLYATQCIFDRKYAHVTKAGSATGCSAKIRTRATTLCGEAQQETAIAGSGASVGVTKFVSNIPKKWAQIGYHRYRAAGSTTALVRRYAETRAGPAPADYDLHTASAPSAGTHKYECYLLSSLFGTWKYEYDGLPFHQFTRNGWRNVTGTHYQWIAEIWNRKDQMVGTASSKCNYTDCRYRLSWGSPQNANIGTGDLHTDDPNQWGIERVSSTAFNVWDKNP